MFLEIRNLDHESVFGKMSVRQKDYDQMKTEAEELIELEKKGVNSVKEIEMYFNRWENIAQRLAAGRKKIDKINGTAKRAGIADFEDKLFHLYRFLLKMLGFYDMVIKKVMEKLGEPILHKQMQARIMKSLA